MNIYNKINYVILSHPRSGNHWMRYIIEFISKCPTLGAGDYKWATTVDAPIFDRLNENLYKNKKYIAFKRHKANSKELKDKKIIFILRDYKDILFRKHGLDFFLNKNRINTINTINEYIKLVDFFEQFSGDKILINYENLIDIKKDQLVLLCDFLNLNYKNIDIFLNNIDKHKNKCFSLYDNLDRSRTRGDVNFYKKKVSDDIVMEIDKYFKEKYTRLDKYFKRYRRD